MKHTTRILIVAALVLFGTAAIPFEDGFEARALEPKDIKAISIDAAPAVPVQNVKVDAAGLLTAVKLGPPIPPQPGIPKCTYPGIAGHPQVQPAGFTGNPVSWSQLMLGAQFPLGNSFLSPTGAYTLRAQNPPKLGPPMFGKYIAVPFVAQANSNYTLSWVSVQGQGEVPGYSVTRVANSIFVSFSPCAGDLRAYDRFSADPWLNICRASLKSASMKYGTTGAQGQCPLQAGQTYFINFAFVEPADGLTTTETTCGYKPAEGRCEVNLQGK